MKELIIFVFLAFTSTLIWGQTTPAPSPPPPAPFPDFYKKKENQYKRPANLKVRNLNYDYSQFHVDRILMTFGNQIQNIDTELTLYLLGENTNGRNMINKIKEEIKVLTGKKSAVYLLMNIKGHVAECEVGLSPELPEEIRLEVQEVKICDRIKDK